MYIQLCELHIDVAERLNAAAKELYGIENFVDLIAGETVTCDAEELMGWLTEKNLEPLM